MFPFPRKLPHLPETLRRPLPIRAKAEWLCLRESDSSGSALLITLTMVLLISIVILVFVTQVSLERQLSSVNLASQQASMIAQTGFDAALEQLRTEFTPYDDPFNTNTARPTTFWSLSPGRMDHFDLATSATGRPRLNRSVTLHSGFDSATPTNELVDLNAKDSMGQRPIWQEDRPMPVQWKSVLQSPTQPAASDNVIVGRYAYWVDDEGAKINVNTADGSENYMLSGYGQGTPTSVSLSVFADGGNANAPDVDQVRQIAASARNEPFREVSEMSTRPELVDLGINASFTTTNQFDLTTYNRSPDFNIFNLPKFQLIPTNMGALWQLSGAGNHVIVNWMVHYGRFPWYYSTPGGTTGAVSGMKSLYPSPNQLTNAWTNAYPVMPAYSMTRSSAGGTADYPLPGYAYQLVASSAKRSNAGGNFLDAQTSRFAAMVQMERYFAGTNALGQAIFWPFRDANYLAKYNLRQLDSITLQFFEMARAVNVGTSYQGPADSGGANDNAIQGPGFAPYGILGTKPVMSAVGRYPRLTRVFGQFNLQERAPVYTETGPGPTRLDVNGDSIIDANDRVFYDGANLRSSIAFSVYMPRHLYTPDNHVGNTLFDTSAWGTTPIGWKSEADAAQADGLNEMDWVSGAGSLLNPTSWWMDTLFYAEAWDTASSSWIPGNSAGIDFRGNRPDQNDPDPRAASMRRPEYRTGLTPRVWGTGYSTNRFSPLLQYEIFGPNPQVTGPAPGLLQNIAANQAAHPSGAGGPRNQIFRTRNLGNRIERIRLRGGLTMRLFIGNQVTVRSLSPMENIAGPIFGGSSDPLALTRTSLTNSTEVNDWRATATNRVVPIFGRDGMELALDQTRYVVAKVRDPLGGMFPGDWVVRTSNSPPGTDVTGNPEIFTNWPRNDYQYGILQSPQTFFGFSPAPGVRNKPEPEWMDMAADSGALNILAGQPVAAVSSSGSILRFSTVNGQQQVQEIAAGGVNNNRVMDISKQLSFPSVGRLQYVRTGAMPDNDAAVAGDPDYAGMPFRLLNFGPENTQGGIPDWAMLDLFMVPNIIWTTPSSRLAYPPVNAAETNRPTLIHLTYGGASNGKINLNGSVIWPWAENNSNYVRTKPLAAQFNGLRYNQNGEVNRRYEIGGTTSWNTPRLKVITHTNSWQVMSAASAETLAGAIAAYIRQNGPLSLPGQMCDILAVNNYGAQIPTVLNGVSLLPPTASGSSRNPATDDFYAAGVHSDGVNRTRNDIVSQSIGNLTTQGNVFSVWVVGQTLKKSPTNTSGNDGVFEPDRGDRITSESRMRFIVERMLDPGVDGIYGNSRPKTTAANTVGPAGRDDTVGTPDDLVDLVNPSYHPQNPRFIYKVLNAYEVK